MDKLDMINDKLDMILETDEMEILRCFYDENVLNPEGELHHLSNDDKLRDFMESLGNDEEEDTSFKMEYSNVGFKE